MTPSFARPSDHSHIPRGALRLAFRLPVLLYRLRLGWLLGHRFLLLTHRGRKTGTIRRTMLEVVQYDPTTHESIVLSGWGTRADWYRNIHIHAPLRVRTGRLVYAPVYRDLTREEAEAVADRWERAHPWGARLAPRIFRAIGWTGDDASARHALPADLPMVAFRPRADRAAPA